MQAGKQPALGPATSRHGKSGPYPGLWGTRVFGYMARPVHCLVVCAGLFQEPVRSQKRNVLCDWESEISHW